jgi:glycine oxidase
MSERGTDVLVIGGGVIGCAIAWELALRGRAVTVIERDVPGRGATWAAGGMLSPLSEAAHAEPFFHLAVESLDRWPAFATRIARTVGIDVEYRPSGKLHVAFTAGETAMLHEMRMRGAGFGVQLLGGDEARALEPALSSAVRGALLVGRDHRVNTRVLGEALWKCAESAGVTFRLGSAARRIYTEAGRVSGVDLENGTRCDCGKLVIAAGAWSSQLEGLPRSLPVHPVRGQMFAVEPGNGNVRLEHVIEAPGCYLIPRESGRIVVGATSERVGFEPGPTVAGIAPLMHAAVRALPALGTMPLAETWAGFRPASPDDLPVMGADPEMSGVYYATGHYRNGVLLAPITAEILTSLLTGVAPLLPIDAFRADRF